MKAETKKIITEQTLEIGPVFAKEAELETVEAEANVIDIRESQFGYFLNVDVDGKKHAVNVRGVQKGELAPTAKKFRLELWTATRQFKPANSPNTIKVGDKRVFALTA